MMMTPSFWEDASAGVAGDMVARFAELVPRIETARLTLRAPRLDDYPIYSGFQRTDRGQGLRETGADHESWLDFCQIVASWPLRGFGPWTLETRAGDAVGLTSIDHEFGDPEMEIGWLVAPEAESQGYASEAARAALGYVFDTLGRNSIVSYVDPQNHRSARVAERLGASRDRVAEDALDGAVLVYRHFPEHLQ